MNLSGGETVVALIAACLFGVAAFLLAENSRKVHGRTPWRIPPLVWGLVGVLFGVFGFLLFLIARATSRLGPQARPFPPANGVTPPWGVSPGQPTFPPRYPGSSDQDGGPGVPSPTGDPPISPPMWHPDPSGRYELRWWDGERVDVSGGQPWGSARRRKSRSAHPTVLIRLNGTDPTVLIRRY